jgi:hypothetical protein
MNGVVAIRRTLIASLSVSCLLAACKDCEQETVYDRTSLHSEVVPISYPAIRCSVETVCVDAYALNGKYTRTFPILFKVRDRFHDRTNWDACRLRFNRTPPLECRYDITWDRLCADSGSGSPGQSGDVNVTIGVGAGATGGDYLDPVQSEEGAGGAPGQSGAEQGQGET